MNNLGRSASPTNEKITALYERLSRDDGEDSVSNSILNQQAFLEDYAKKTALPTLSILPTTGGAAQTLNARHGKH
jgi:hypothetical protein